MPPAIGMLFSHNNKLWGHMQASNSPRQDIWLLTSEERAQIVWDNVKVLCTWGDRLALYVDRRPLSLSERLTSVSHIYMDCLDTSITAFGMGMHSRLGDRSPLRTLDDEVAQMIFRLAFE